MDSLQELILCVGHVKQHITRNQGRHTNVNEVVCLSNHLNVCHLLSARLKVYCRAPLTSILNAMFRQNTVAPIADTPNNLYTARSMRGA
jgi:hypothetical protein